MIIRRYLSMQLLVTCLAVTSLLTLILMGGRVIKYFGMAADGRLDASLLSAVLLYRLPGFLELIIPLSFFIAVLLVFGRLYIDNEMAVLQSSGIGRWQLVAALLPIVLLMTLLVAAFSFYLTPQGNYLSEKLFSKQESRNTFDMVKVGEFQRLGNNMLYARALSADKSQLLDVTLYSQKDKTDGSTQQILLYAKQATRLFDEPTGLTFLVLQGGRRYEFAPNKIAYNRLDFDEYRMRINTQAVEKEVKRARSFSSDLIYHKQQQGDLLALGEWLWRCSLPCLVLTGLLLAIALAKVNPRQGRYLKLLPAILLYVSLVVMIGAVRNKIEKGKLGQVALWSVHGFYLGLAVFLLAWEDIKLRYQAWRYQQQGTPT